MIPPPIHILHLSATALRWATLQGGRRQPRLHSTGMIEGDPILCLDQWLQRQAPEEDREIYLYDSRPLYFSFTLQLPAKARKQMDNVVRLRIRQDLGLGDDAVRSAAGPEASAKSGSLLNLFAVVTRREAMDDLLEWKELNKLNSLWVGSDVGAIHALISHGLFSAPVLVLQPELTGDSIYYADDHGKILKSRAANLAGLSAAALPWDETVPLALFGKIPRDEILEEIPALGGHASVSPRFERPLHLKAPAQEFLLLHGDELAQFDAVILGGIIESGISRVAMGSLLGEVDLPSPFSRWGRSLSLARLTAAVVTCALLLAVSAGFVQHQRSTAKAVLAERARRLEPDTKKLRAQQAVLERIKTDRLRVMPILQAVHEAAPPQVTLQTFDITETGVLQMSASAKTEGGGAAIPTTFFKTLSAARELEKVQLQNMKVDAQKKVVTFQISAQVKGRGVRSRK